MSIYRYWWPHWQTFIMQQWKEVFCFFRGWNLTKRRKETWTVKWRLNLMYESSKLNKCFAINETKGQLDMNPRQLMSWQKHKVKPIGGFVKVARPLHCSVVANVETFERFPTAFCRFLVARPCYIGSWDFQHFARNPFSIIRLICCMASPSNRQRLSSFWRAFE